MKVKLKSRNLHFWIIELNIYLMNLSLLEKIKIMIEDKIKLNGFKNLSINLYLEDNIIKKLTLEFQAALSHKCLN